MKKAFKWMILAASLTAVAAVGCVKSSDLDEVNGRIDGLEKRVVTLEEQVKQLNEVDVPGLASLVRGLQGNITVASVVETDEGYVINFSDGTTATIKNGVDGKAVNGYDGVTILSIEESEEGYLITFSDGQKVFLKHGKSGIDAQKIGIKPVDGVYYWTIDGEVLTDDEGNPIPVSGVDGEDGTTPKVSITLEDGIYVWTVNGAVLKDDEGHSIPVAGKDGKDGVTPQFGILDGHWVVSYDNGETWKTLGLTSDTDYSAYIDPDKETDDYIVLVVGATEVQIPKEKAFTLTFTTIENNGVKAGETVSFPYTISGVNASDETDVDVIGIIGDWTAEVVPTDNASGVLKVTATENVAAKVTVYAANHKGKTDIRTLKFEEGVLEAIIETHDIDWEGGELDLAVKTNVSYHIFIPAAAEDWITVSPETRVRTDNYTIQVAKNETGSYRQTTLQVLDAKGNSVKDIEILQYANPDAATDLASVVALPDDKAVSLKGVTVVAASKQSTIVTDGEAFSYVAGYAGEAGKVINVTGTKKTDGFGLGYVEAGEVTVDAEAQAVQVSTKEHYLYYGMGQNDFDYFYTSYNGVVAEQDGVYYLAGLEKPQQFVVEDPVQDLSALVGRLVALSGWVKTVDFEKDVKEDIHIVLTDIHAVSFSQETGWELYYGGPNSGNASYPEVIGNNVASPVEGNYYTLSVYAAAALSQYESMSDFLLSSLTSLSDDVLYYITLYHQYYGDSYDDAFAYLAHVESAYESFREFPYGQYVIVAAGVDAEGRLSGKFNYSVFEKKDPSVFAKYEDFLGEWKLGSDIVTIEEKVNGETYSISGLPGYDGNNYPAVEGVYDAEAGKFTVSDQALRDFTNANYGACKRIFQGVFTSGNEYGYYWFNSSRYNDEPTVIFTAALQDDGSVNLEAGSCPYGTYSGFRYAWVIVNEANPNYRAGNWLSTTALPNQLTKVAVDMDSYNSWIGSWQFGDQTWTIAPKVEGKTYSVTGIAGISDLPIEAQFNAATSAFELYEQEDIATVNLTLEQGADPVPAVVCLFGDILFNGQYYYWGGGSKLATAVLSASNTATLTPEPCSTYGDFVGFTYYGVVGSSVYNLTDRVTLPREVRSASGSSVKTSSLVSDMFSRGLVLDGLKVSSDVQEKAVFQQYNAPAEAQPVRNTRGAFDKARKF
ncbi:MAG: hypothetical protein IJ654_09350 [Bacteroidales bacterium]|nr:hypothetical protein [Bacteroidales bacterium]